ncbi:hypothetical protein APY94_01920 [Thermococcus celericrescens]|uniref:Uncharacterized protein n=2 Tax=Thermococcus celericrescens TaxID=227598 RepID=A0A117IU89_9EURY|nr:hypothetical protein APY94_01920 [Thermococcus celericrescens]
MFLRILYPDQAFKYYVSGILGMNGAFTDLLPALKGRISKEKGKNDPGIDSFLVLEVRRKAPG